MSANFDSRAKNQGINQTPAPAVSQKVNFDLANLKTGTPSTGNALKATTTNEPRKTLERAGQPIAELGFPPGTPNEIPTPEQALLLAKKNLG